MKCSQCQTEITEANAFCPVCGKPVPHNRQSNPEVPEVLEPELLNGREQNYGQNRNQTSDNFQQILYTNFTHPVSSSGCLPFVATFILAGVAAAMYGFLAGLGFLFFSFVGFGLAFFISIKRLLLGKSIQPLLAGLVVWTISWLLTAWLSGGLG